MHMVIYRRICTSTCHTIFNMMNVGSSTNCKWFSYFTSHHAVLMNYTDNWESQTAKVQIVVSDEYPDGIIRSAIPLDHDDADGFLSGSGMKSGWIL